MNTAKWGPSSWGFLHSMGQWAPEVLNEDQVGALICLSEFLAKIMPCIYCRRSYRDFSSQVPLKRILTKERPYLILWQWWLWVIHNKVNDKLDRPRLSVEEFLQERSRYQQLSKEAWIAHLWNLLFCIAWNYQPERKDIYQTFFGYCLPRLFSAFDLPDSPLLCQLFQETKACDSPIEWIAWLQGQAQHCGREDEGFDQLCQRLESYKAKSCSKTGCH